ncbi:unnamed protein product, partial [Prorocentrum cordatum]
PFWLGLARSHGRGGAASARARLCGSWRPRGPGPARPGPRLDLLPAAPGVRRPSRLAEPLCQGRLSAAQLATRAGVREAPLRLVLRACGVLGYVSLDRAAGTYSANRGPELEALLALLGPRGPLAEALSGVYRRAAPPFRVPSDAARYCLSVWSQHRPAWRQQGRSAALLPLLLDGVALTPLLVSMTYFARWDDRGGDAEERTRAAEADFGELDPDLHDAFLSMCEGVGVRVLKGPGTLRVPVQSLEALTACYCMYVPASLASLLAGFGGTLLEDASWDPTRPISAAACHKMLHAVGSRAWHLPLYEGMLRQIGHAFGTGDVHSQPKFVVVAGAGDSCLLSQIHDYIKEHTARGRLLEEHPVVMVAVDPDLRARTAAAVRLAQRRVPHKVLDGAAEMTDGLAQLLERSGVQLDRALHVHAFLHAWPHVAPRKRLDPALEAFARAALADAACTDASGRPVSAEALFGALVEHFERWHGVLHGSAGLCLVEAVLSDVPTGRQFLSEHAAFSHEIVQSLSRKGMVSPSALCMAAAAAGLLPADARTVQAHPAESRHCCAVNLRLVARPFRVRLAMASDLPDLVRLELVAWEEHLRTPREGLRRRLEAAPLANYVCELDGRVVAVLYTQRVSDLGAVQGQQFQRASDAHAPGGRHVQLLSIAADPGRVGLGLGSELRQLALLLARLDPGTDSVCAVTRAKGSEFRGFAGSMEAYLAEHVAGRRVDPIVNFHTSFGARFVRLVAGFRPEDVDNQGIGVLIQYNVQELSRMTGSSEAAPDAPAGTALERHMPSGELLAQIMERLGYEVDHENPSRGFFDYGMDSLELVRMQNSVCGALGMQLPATLVLDFPSYEALEDELDRRRGTGSYARGEGWKQEPVGLGSAAEGPEDGAQTVWSSLTARDVVAIQGECRAVYSTAAYQKRFGDYARRCYPDMAMYCLAIEPVLCEVEGPILLERGLVAATDFATVQQARTELAGRALKFWASVPELRSRANGIAHLTKVDQIWS